MATVYDLKPRFQARLRPLVRALAAAGVTANQVTLAALALSAAWGGLMILALPSVGPFLLLPLVLLVRMALNAIDGMLAREHRMASRLGAVLNELGDVIADAALYLPFAALPGVTPWLVGLVVALAGATELAGVLGVTVGGGRRYDGPMGKSDRATAFGLLGFLIGVGVVPGLWLDLVLWLVAALLVGTIANRVRRALAEAGP